MSVKFWKLFAAGSLASAIVFTSSPLATRLAADEPVSPAEKERMDKAKKLQAEFDKAEAEGKVPNGALPPNAFNDQMQKQMQDAFRQLQAQGFGNPTMLNGPMGRPRNPRLGVQVVTPSPELVDQLDLPKDQGIVVQDVVADSPAEKAGIKRNDILLEIGGKKVPVTLEALVKLLDEFPADQALEAKVIRKGRPETIKGLKLAKASAAAAPAVPFAPFRAAVPFVDDAIPFAVLSGNSSMSVSVVNGNFTIRATADGKEYTVVGKKEGDAKTVTSVKVKDGDKNLSFDKLDAVPKEYRGTVEKLLDGVK